MRFQDHPRSRGVYRRCRPGGSDDHGSSPLARGLRSLVNLRVNGIRIIPARAGFTPRQCRPASARPDHPRSRGVYTMPAQSRIEMPGSSPLARGLLDGNRRVRGEHRIIPARAGFTGRLRRSKDSPEGSSPLARGLLCVDGANAAGQRIIPARAGFTTSRASNQPSMKDHPRSRGVYDPFSSASVALAGSSPLARGLLRG